METSPLISIIMPTYNRRHVIQAAIDSVYRQTYKNWELIIVDDGSTDNTYAWIQQTYPQLRLIHQDNSGVSAARNNGIEQAQGEWIAFLDSDDVWLSNKLQRQMEQLNLQSAYKICHTDEIWIRNGRRVNPMKKHKKYGGWIFQRCLALCLISPSSVIIHRDVFVELGTFDTSLPACEDYDLWLRICARYAVLYIDELLIQKQGGHEDQLSKKYVAMDRFRIQALKKILVAPCLRKDDKRAAQQMLAKKVAIYLKGAIKRKRYDEVSLLSDVIPPFDREMT